MKSKIIFSLLLFFTTFFVGKASNAVFKEDTNKVLLLKKMDTLPLKKKDYKISEAYFYQSYSFDSTSFFMIKDFFKERNIKHDKIGRPLLLLPVSFVSFILWAVLSIGSAVKLLVIQLAIFSIGLFALALFFLAFYLLFLRLVRYSKYNSKKLLLRQLIFYSKTI